MGSMSKDCQRQAALALKKMRKQILRRKDGTRKRALICFKLSGRDIFFNYLFNNFLDANEG